MLYSNRIPLTVIMLSIAVLGCVVPTIAVQDPNAVSTAAAQTVIASLVQGALSETVTPTSQIPTLTFTPETPTLTPTHTETPWPTVTPSLTLIPTLPFTPTPVVPQISVTVPTNCRVGPGKVYRMVGALLVGELAEVYGRDPTGRYWYIRNPDSGNNFCWVWGEYATVSGNTALLPVYTPPPTPIPTNTPTPTPAFEAIYVGLDKCTGWWAEIQLRNTGSLDFRSMSIAVRDTVTDVVVASFSDGFTNLDGCLTSTTRDTLHAGRTPVISAPAFNYDPTGHRLRATITVCTNLGQSGTCVTDTIVFTP